MIGTCDYISFKHIHNYLIQKIPNDKYQITNKYQNTMFKKTKKERRKNNISADSVLNFYFLVIGIYLFFVICFLLFVNMGLFYTIFVEIQNNGSFNVFDTGKPGK